MPSRFASLPLSCSYAFFWVGLLGLYFLDSTCLGFFYYGQIGLGYHFVGFTNMVNAEFFLRRGGIFEAMGDGLDLTLLGGSESGVREVE